MDFFLSISVSALLSLSFQRIHYAPTSESKLSQGEKSL